MKITVLALLILFSTMGFSQNILSKKIQWLSNYTVELPGRSMVKESTIMITYSNDSIVWKNESGGVVEKFIIKETHGDWPTIRGDGEMMYQVEKGYVKGNVSITTISGHTKIRIFYIENKVPVIRELYVTETQVLK